MLLEKKAYNAMLERYNRACDYFEDDSVEYKDKLKFYDAYVGLLNGLSGALKLWKDQGYVPTLNERINGFELEGLE